MDNYAIQEDGSPEASLKERILLSAIDEFSRRGYSAASTNTIVSMAGTSKGLLFHYYGNKEELFLECAGYVVEKMVQYVKERLHFNSSDIFSRFRQSLELKMCFYRDHPTYAGLVSAMWYSEEFPSKIEEHIRKHIGHALDFYTPPIFDDADLSKLSDGTDIRRVIGYAGMLLDACWLRFSGKYGNDIYLIGEHTDEFLSEADFILNLFIHGAYSQ